MYQYSGSNVYTRIHSGHNYASAYQMSPKSVTFNAPSSSFNKLTVSAIYNAAYKISVSTIIDTSDFELIGENLYNSVPDTGTYKISMDLSKYTWVMVSSKYTKATGTEWQHLILNVPTHQYGCLQTWNSVGNGGRNFLAIQALEDSLNVFVRQNNNYGYIWNVWGYR